MCSESLRWDCTQWEVCAQKCTHTHAHTHSVLFSLPSLTHSLMGFWERKLWSQMHMTSFGAKASGGGEGELMRVPLGQHFLSHPPPKGRPLFSAAQICHQTRLPSLTVPRTQTQHPSETIIFQAAEGSSGGREGFFLSLSSPGS